MAAFCCYRATQKINAPKWTEHLLLSADPKSRIDAYIMAAGPPVCMQAILALAHLHNSPVIQFHKRVVVRTDPMHANEPHSEVFMLDPADQEPPQEYQNYVRDNPGA